jgi:hypothetical protein
MKMMEGAFSRAISNRFATSFSLSPIHFERRSDKDILQFVHHSSIFLKYKGLERNTQYTK